MGALKLAPVLASGCCTIIKPSSETSLSILELARIIKDIIPKGVFNVITGRGSKSGQYILDHPKLSKLAFTGSTEVGREVGLAAAKKIIPSTLELGGKSANIFFDDFNLISRLKVLLWVYYLVKGKYVLLEVEFLFRILFMINSWKHL